MRDLPRKLARPRNAAIALLAAFVAAYAADAGHGFIKDDFRWVRETRVGSLGDVAALFERSDGFYRPMVSLTFAANSTSTGLAPRPFGLTNLLLAIVDAALLWLLARRLELEAGPALFAAAAWAFNFHGINMAVLWISGRTALVATLFALATAAAAVSRRPWLAGLCCLLAMLSKEEAVLLPLIIVMLNGRRAWPCFAAMAIYIVLRLRTDAFWVGNAPDYYRLTFSPMAAGRNVLQYADRAVTWPGVAALVTYAASASRARLNAVEKRIAIFGAIWLVCMFAITIFVPVRSSLYAVLPSVGSALAAGALASASLRTAPQRVTVAMTGLILLVVLLEPVYWRRNERWVQLADLSTSVVGEVRAIAEREAGRPIVLIDDPAARFNLEATFGSIWPDAAALFLPPGTNARIAHEGALPPDAILLRLDSGRGGLTRAR